MRHLPIVAPIVAHADISAPSDRVHCDRFATTLTAEACAGRTLAVKLRPGHTRAVPMQGIARHAPCAGCALGAEARTRLGMKGRPGRVDAVDLSAQALIPLQSESFEYSRTARLAPTDADARALVECGWVRGERGWIDPHGQLFSDEAAARIAGHERTVLSMIPKNKRPLALREHAR